ncbi:hypothetical protein HMPREF0973_02529 [Prevotella veroralis F0319]|uniref:Uncharacterized protein n=1 Tax=Prevotella veroralis F0319 TaxID=649761 RepID=C9MSB2_9BACT|nr:hypothetical protein HMPREF0973_02529 [Prevotella veroralis F0319]
MPLPCPIYSLSLNPSTASPPPPLRMERGVNSAVCVRRDGGLVYNETVPR